MSGALLCFVVRSVFLFQSKIPPPILEHHRFFLWVCFSFVVFAGLALPVCESLATALFVKGLQGQGTEEEAWNVLDYIRQRGMVHRPEVSQIVS